jgi:hypothetical protein
MYCAFKEFENKNVSLYDYDYIDKDTYNIQENGILQHQHSRSQKVCECKGVGGK